MKHLGFIDSQFHEKNLYKKYFNIRKRNLQSDNLTS